MARDANQIIDDATKRFDVGRNIQGFLNRSDIIDFIETLPEDADKRAEVMNFLNNFPFLTSEDKLKVQNDLSSYGI